MTGKLTILGCGSAMPTFQNSPTGQIVELCDKSFLVDCGEGTQLKMRQLGVKTARLYTADFAFAWRSLFWFDRLDFYLGYDGQNATVAYLCAC